MSIRYCPTHFAFCNKARSTDVYTHIWGRSGLQKSDNQISRIPRHQMYSSTFTPLVRQCNLPKQTGNLICASISWGNWGSRGLQAASVNRAHNQRKLIPRHTCSPSAERFHVCLQATLLLSAVHGTEGKVGIAKIVGLLRDVSATKMTKQHLTLRNRSPAGGRTKDQRTSSGHVASCCSMNLVRNCNSEKAELHKY